MAYPSPIIAGITSGKISGAPCSKQSGIKNGVLLKNGVQQNGVQQAPQKNLNKN